MKISHFYIFCDRAQTLRGTIYMFHWLVVMVSTTTRISVRPKRLKWIKTVHQEASGENFPPFITIATVKIDIDFANSKVGIVPLRCRSGNRLQAVRIRSIGQG